MEALGLAVGKELSKSGKKSRGTLSGKASRGTLSGKASRGASLGCAMEKLLLAWRKLPWKLLPPPNHCLFGKCNPFPRYVRTLVEVGGLGSHLALGSHLSRADQYVWWWPCCNFVQHHRLVSHYFHEAVS